MKTLRFLLALSLCASTLAARAEDRGERREGRSHASHARRPAPQVMHLGHGAPARPAGAYRPPAVRYDVGHAPLRPGARPAVWHAPDHAVIGAAGFAAAVFAHEAVEIAVGRTYWHAEGGMHYAHFYDGHVHWYGFYDGPRFYWTRYEDRRWWWFDEPHGRWVYWYGGYWWWQNPANATPYVIINDNYYPYAEIEEQPQLAPAVAAAPPPPNANAAPPSVSEAPSGAPTMPPGGSTPAPDTAQVSPSAPPPPAGTTNGSPEAPAQGATADAKAAMKELDQAGQRGRVFISPDSAREVDINGPRREAFLYDRTGGGDPQFIAFLAAGVRKAQFSEPTGGKTQILLLMKDGSYDIFDAQGHSLLQSSASGASSGDGAQAASAAPPGEPAQAPPPDDGSSQQPPSAPPGQ